MQIQLQREELLKPIGIVAGVVERRQTLPILSYILVKSANGKISFTGTDLEVEVIATVSGGADKSGEFTVPARKLFDICRALPEGSSITLTKQGEKVALKSGKSRFTLSTLPATDFPTVEASQFEQALTVSQAKLKGAIDRAGFCMAQQDVRYYLNGLYLEISERSLRAVATDGHRMAVTGADCRSDSNAQLQVIIPRKGVQEISRLLVTEGGEVTLQLSANHARLTIDNLTFTSKLIDGKFPDYTKVIPNNQTKLVPLDRYLFREALGRVAILANEKYRGIRLNLEAGLLRLTAHNPEQEEATEELETAYAGESLEIGFNVNYLIEAVNAISSKTVVVGLSDSNSSCTLKPEDDKDTQYIVMPMRL